MILLAPVLVNLDVKTSSRFCLFTIPLNAVL